MITKEQLDRYLKNECDSEEEVMVRQWMDRYPEQVLELLPVEELNEIEVASWNAERSAAFFSILEGKISRPAKLRRLLRVTAVAASIILLVSVTVWMTRTSRKSGEEPLAENKSATSSLLVRKWNDSSQPLQLSLPDGSIVSLASKSGIDYSADLGKGVERLVTLHGEAFFQVAKNREKPFRVISGAISTTAVGTSFTITAFDKDPSIRVHLHTGKVIVAPAEQSAQPMFADIAMNPGQQLIYDKMKLTASLVDLDAQKLANKPVTTKIRELPGEMPEWYQFNGQTLPQVFEQLGNYYRVVIDYVPAEVNNRYFTGKFAETDSIETILRDISVLHRLKMEKVNNVYKFRKK